MIWRIRRIEVTDETFDADERAQVIEVERMSTFQPGTQTTAVWVVEPVSPDDVG